MILICANITNPSYVPTAWQGTLITVGVALFSVLFNTYAARQLPLFEGFIMLFDILGFFAVLIPLWVLAPKVSAREVFQEAENFGGWATLGTGVIVGQIASLGERLHAVTASGPFSRVPSLHVSVEATGSVRKAEDSHNPKCA